QMDIFNNLILNITKYNEKIHVFNINNKYDSNVDSDLISIRKRTEKIISEKMNNINHDVIPFNSYRAFAYNHILIQGLEELEIKYIDDVATRELSSSWREIQKQELLVNLKEKIKEKAGTKSDYKLLCGLDLLETAINKFLDNIDEVYCGKLELIIGDKKLNASSQSGFADIMDGYGAIIGYIKTSGKYDDGS